MDRLMAISPVDGRYGERVRELIPFFSEFGLMRYRVMVETEYFIALSQEHLPQFDGFPAEGERELRALCCSFSPADAEYIKQQEIVTNHDVKAVEYFVKEKVSAMGLGRWSEFVHFGLTSQDINNTAMPMAIRDSVREVLNPMLLTLRDALKAMGAEWADIPMLARTHGQPATPTRLGKEMAVFTERLDNELSTLESMKYSGKFGGATGNFNAHRVAYPQINWPEFADKLLREKLSLERQQTTTQIEHYDGLAELFNSISRINTIITDLCRDMWSYISLDYFKQTIVKGEVGSSAMPHKVNPIDFENAEGNLGVANALLGHLAAKLPVSRLQRDLTDSTVIRNTGVAMAHSLIAWKSVKKGLSKLIVNHEKIRSDLEENWVVVAEALQTILRREGYPQPYETLMALTRTNEKITGETIRRFIDTLDVSDAVKDEMKAVTPFNYTGF
ncbi:MAG: adenylosuccinate lyase [Bacteroidales bacterium]|nr:adenylosuccinate lyase [Bacteroidales bacterium]HNT92963.1 adenylosuccinate lyase [Bacteroidales bacterium]HPE21487.1 adenylosuccinate lyase [Bacteroidales bacterium]HPQ62767.1 adenylosuccinate lyase [Bacteroidales bacterium]HRW27214.1 adenylosuccinate lyase [Bacteroidales bacterium]